MGTVVEIFGYTAIDPVLSVLSLACEGGCILEDPHAEYERHLNLVELYMKNPEQYPRRPECPLDGKNSLACPKEEMKSLRNTESTTSSEDSLSTRIFHLLGKSPKSLLHLLIQFQEKSLKEIEDAISEVTFDIPLHLLKFA